MQKTLEMIFDYDVEWDHIGATTEIRAHIATTREDDIGAFIFRGMFLDVNNLFILGGSGGLSK